MSDEKKESGNLAEQIKLARRSIESWPKWLQDSAHFQGKNHPSECLNPPSVENDRVEKKTK